MESIEKRNDGERWGPEMTEHTDGLRGNCQVNRVKTCGRDSSPK